ncbi:GNAT family N-acetyltransferase [Rhizobium sp. P32RR-XVIII]|uniref:GNAT family N-acetyltransferase n=1 Tax=Rhizobium sp. P32RR-XVIII TaxID=2726738 RepID=UPI0014577EA7|nr:GNAT family N-acetyltransferase [Rhizobium sp. P32RR-XVIII]NLS05089.1 GNAT family N-acetyltransferase [Rhizobium sp. P32RR-XVIII]
MRLRSLLNLKMKALDVNGFTDKSCVVITDISQMTELEREWNELWLKAKGSFYQSYSTAYHSWNEISRPAGRSLFCIVVREKGKMVLVFPLVRYRNGPCWMMRPLGPDAGQTTDVLVDPQSNYQENLKLAWRTIEQLSKVDIVRMPCVKVGSTLDHLIKSKRNLGCEPDIAPFADLQDQTNWDAYAKIIGANSRQQLNRKRKRLSEMGNFEFIEVDPVTDPTYAIELMEWMFTQKKIWSERVGKRGPWITSKEYRNFVRKWITDPDNIQMMRIYAIVIDKVPIALKLASYSVSHMDLIIAAFHSDPQYAKYSPGFVLDEFWMKIVFEKRLNVDFGAGNEPYKLFWSRNVKNDLASYHVPQTLIGNTATQLWRLKCETITHLAERKKRQADLANAA